MSNQIQLPPYGLTLLPPWWCAILWAGKRVENRVQSVAWRIGKYRGPVAITSSKSWSMEDTADACAIIREDINPPWTGERPILSWDSLRKLSGMVVGVADIVDVRANGPHPVDPWAVPGQWGIHLDNVREVQPVQCTGGRGFFSFGACGQCGRPTAYERKPGLQCRSCKRVTIHGYVGEIAELEIIRQAFGK